MSDDGHFSTPARLAVLLSGSGRTLDNLLTAIREKRLAALIELVIASKECPGAEKARAAGLRTVIVQGEIPCQELQRLLEAQAIEWVVCAGYLKYLHVPATYMGRVVNIHPSLLPAFGGAGMYGDRVHEHVLRSGAKETGCTVHLVDEVYDRGRVLLQRTCPVLPTDDARTLAARVFAQECAAYPEALQRLIEKGV